MHRILAVLIALLLAGGLTTAVVKNDEKKQVAEPSPTPTETMTFDNTPAPFDTGTPIVPPLTPTPTSTGAALPGTGATSSTPLAAMMLVVAALGGFSIWRASRPGPAPRR